MVNFLCIARTSPTLSHSQNRQINNIFLLISQIAVGVTYWTVERENAVRRGFVTGVICSGS